jgi:hypothetical protein
VELGADPEARRYEDSLSPLLADLNDLFNAYNRLADIAHTANGGGVALPRIITYTPAGHVILYKAPSYSAVKCVSYFLNSPTDPLLDTCMPLDSIQAQFTNPPAVDMYLFQYPAYVFTAKYGSATVSSLSQDCDCLSSEDSLNQGALIAFFSLVTSAVFVLAFWFLAVVPVIGRSSAASTATGPVSKNPLNTESGASEHL